jgi:hypothetical protein
MPTITFLKPLDQPFAGMRSVDWLRVALASGEFDSFRLIVAYVREGELIRLQHDISKFQGGGGIIEAIVGLDQGLTSRQALRFMLEQFDSARVWQHPSPLITFHPKTYLFEGVTAAEVHVGSCNLTVGGLEVNCEAAVRLQYDRPAEDGAWADARAMWEGLVHHPNTVALSAEFIGELEANGSICDESVSTWGTKTKVDKAVVGPQRFPSTPFQPPSARPKAPKTKTLAKTKTSKATATAPAPLSLPLALLIQINPQHNGEVFLSKQAVDQNKDFFGFPFTGLTTPKKNNPPYPQRVPDPVTNWVVYKKSGKSGLVVEGFGLNTVFYKKKSEIRITVSPELRQAIVPLSILQMTASEQTGVDYSCEVFTPGSPQYKKLLPACTQTMPSGGKKAGRRFGWL